MRFVGLVVVALGLASCIKPNLTSCGDIDCPAGAACVGSADAIHCASSDQLAACSGAADGTACNYGTTNGLCADGACEQSVCGNGVLEPGEACDGSDVPVSCADFGYYAGEVTCTSVCNYDKSSCSGRCGDGVVQALAGELCDTKPPSSTCAFYGRDYGALGCSKFCAPDIANDCGFYGWIDEFDDNATASVSAVNGNRHGVIAIDNGKLAVQFDGGSDSQVLGTVTFVAATPDTLLGIGSGGSWRYDVGGWTALPGVGSVLAAVSDGTAVYTVDASCAIQKLDITGAGTVTSVASPGISGCITIDAWAGMLAVVTSTTVAWNKTPSSWMTASWLGPTPSQIGLRGTTAIVVGAGSGSGGSGPDCGDLGCSQGEVEEYDATTGAATYISAATQFAVAANGNIAELDYEGYSENNETIPFAHVEGLRVALPSPADFFGIKLVRAGDGGVMAYGFATAWRLGPTWMSVPQPSLSREPDGTFVTCDGGTLIAYAPNTTTISHAWTHGNCLAVAGPPSGEHFVEAPGQMYRYDTGTSSYVTDMASVGVLGSYGSEIWAATQGGDPTVYAVYRREGSSWVAKPPPASFSISGFVVTPNGAFAMMGASQTSQTLYQWTDATGWVALGDPIAGIYFQAGLDGSMYIQTEGGSLYQWNGTSWVQLPLEVGPHLAPRGNNDLYIGSPTGTLSHWDGTIDAPVNLAPSAYDGDTFPFPTSVMIYNNSSVQLLGWWEPQPSGL